MKQQTYPEGVTISLEALLRFEYEVSGMAVMPQHAVHTLLEGWHPSHQRGRGLDFEEVRLYVPGDDIRNIDWKVTARTGRTHSKVFNEEKERPVFLVVDQSSRVFFGSRQKVKSVIAAEVAALAAFHTLRRGDRAGGLVFNDTEHVYVAPARNKATVQHLLSVVAGMNAQLPARKQLLQGPSILNDMLQRAALLTKQDYMIIVISDFADMDDQTGHSLQQLSAQHDVLLVQLTDPLEAGLPDGRVMLSDGHRQLAWDNHHKHAGTRYRQAFEDMKQQLQDAGRRYQQPVIFVDTASPVTGQLTHFFGKPGL